MCRTPGMYMEELRRLDKAYRRYFQHELRAFALTPGEVTALLFLHNNAPHLDTATDIARCKGLSKALVARSVESLQQKGYLTAARDRKDRRVVHLALSEKSRPISREIEQKQEVILQKLGEGITPGELETAFQTLKRLSENARKYLTGVDDDAQD